MDYDSDDVEMTPVISFDEVRHETPPASSPEINVSKKSKNTKSFPDRKNHSKNRQQDSIDYSASISEEQPRQKTKKQSKRKPKEKGAERLTQDTSVPEEYHWEGNLKGIFEIEGQACDLVLQEDGLSWSSVAVSMKTSKKKKSKKNGSSNGRLSDGADHLIYEDIVGVKIKKIRKAKQGEGEGICQGMVIQTYERRNDGRFKDRPLFFGNPSQDICLQWSRRIEKVLSGFVNRPKKVRVFLQSHAGKKDARSLYKRDIFPLFEVAGITDELTDVNHNEHIKHETVHMDVSQYDCIVCMGGDGTVHKVLNGLLNNLHKTNGVEMKLQTQPNEITIPFGIIPVGTVNQICHTVQGAEDPFTAAVHIILGHHVPVDVCSVYREEKFYRWVFNSHYGFFGSILPYMTKYAMLGEKRLEAAVMKSLTKSKFRSYECELHYLPNSEDPDHHPNNCRTCTAGCPRCSENNSNESAPTHDEVVSLVPLADSNQSAAVRDMTTDTRWKTIKGEFVNISLLSNAACSDLAPKGMSKYSHLTDGCMDLLLVYNTDKKEFVRYLKRHGNDKNQLSLPFVEAFRCKEVRFHARSCSTWDHKDFSFNEILDKVEMGSKKQSLHRAESIEVIDDLDDLGESSAEYEDDIEEMDLTDTDRTSTSTYPRNQKSSTDKTGKLKDKGQPKSVAASWTDPIASRDGLHSTPGYVNHMFEEDEVGSEPQPGSGKTSSKGSAGSRKKTAMERVAEDINMVVHVSDKFRPTVVEQEKARRMKHQRKRAEKKKEKSDSQVKSFWNMDSEIVSDIDLHFRVHQGLIRLCGLGVPVDYHPDSVRMGCLNIF